MAREQELENLLYECIRELGYVQEVENCTSGLCASGLGKDLVERGMELLGVKDLSGETLAETARIAQKGESQ